MKRYKKSSQNRAFLWWTAIISLVVTGALYFFLGQQAELDVTLRQERNIFPLIGLIIAGLCLIAGTAGRWFNPK
ncbi:MAG: hypothetical protein KJN98_03560 [Pontiella sp.]|nr:hypothetical protein [Pontiella sp.]